MNPKYCDSPFIEFCLNHLQPIDQTIIQITSFSHKINLAPVQPQKPRSFCSCKKSSCRKYYCECYSRGEFCQNCLCKNCTNVSSSSSSVLSKKNSCSCKKSSCNKKYCECYQQSKKCSLSCKCEYCKNK